MKMRFLCLLVAQAVLFVTAASMAIDMDEDDEGDLVEMISHDRGLAAVAVTRTKRQATDTTQPCESTYANQSPVHTNCLVDDVNATMKVLNQTMKNYILDLHNQYRANVTPSATNMQKLVWDEKLERTAKKWVMQCNDNHDLNKAEPEWINIGIGQNLGIGHKSWAKALMRFYTEPSRNNYTYGDDYKKGIGHYFQMVSYEATRIGCAQAKCPHKAWKKIRICNYAPSFNADLQPYKNGTSCADCPDFCDDSGKLCDCGGKLCYHGGTLNPLTCNCDCLPIWTGENCEKHDCTVSDYFTSCRDGTLTSDDCGKAGTVIYDPNMCPHLCDICPRCSDVTCENGGTVDNVTCDCICPANFVGTRCQTDCSAHNCNGHGTPGVINGQCGCTCDNGYFGSSCQNSCGQQPYCVQVPQSYCDSYCSSNNVLQTSCPVCCSAVTGC
ncbi:cysteine-rich venom protein Mr30-like [Babylonia areolata]|uniref:cysteine-rich venom protein Mr30-like n=1 Tax=Babylonia areolata TaxID=304850 RepID=UPI003FCF8C31